ncbi:MAG TPA: hypothetical protein VFX03_10490, partial [Thermomicrobiales bacterium]|nr:hypothetical protein [Thermomicrobiales bacterium]
MPDAPPGADTTTSGGLDAERAESSTASPRLTRRLLMLGVGGLGVAAAGFLAARLKSAPQPITDDLAAAPASEPTAGAPAQAPEPAPAAASPAASPRPGA